MAGRGQRKNQYIFQASTGGGPEPESRSWNTATLADTGQPCKETAPSEQTESGKLKGSKHEASE